MRKTTFLFLFILGFALFRAQGQNITFNHLTTDDGLSQFSVNSIYIDGQGIIWIGTREGLNRYNGNDILSFKLNKNDPNSLFSNTVLRITGDKKGKIYLLCTDGVAGFDLETQKFETLIQGNVDAIYYKEKLYIGKKNEIYIFNEGTKNFDLYYRLAGKNIALSCFHLDPQKNLWIGTSGEGVYRLDKDRNLTHPIPKGNITSIYEDSSEELWIGSWEEGLYRVKQDGGIRNLKHDSRNPNSLSSDFVRSCCEDNSGNIWIGTFNGLNRYEKATGNFRLYTTNENRPGSLTHSSVWCIVKDGQGTLWLGTYFGGVNYFNPEYEIYTRYKVGQTEKEGLSSPIIGRMIEDKAGNLWICTEGGGVNVYDRKKGTYRWYRHEEGKNSLSHNNVKAIYYDEKNEIMWIGTHLGGLNKLDIRTSRFTIYRMKAGDPSSIPSDIVRDIVPYRDKLIVATQAGACLFDPVTGKARLLFQETKEGREIKMVASLCLDREGTLWVAATGKGVYTYRFDTGKLTNYAHIPSSPNSLSNNNVNSITQDSEGNLWFSTSGSGLDRYRKETDDFENFDVQSNGLSSDCIYDVCESSVDKGHLLLITNQGFSQFDFRKKTFQNYGIENGFPLTAVNENALYVTRDSAVFLGGVQGMISFSEKSLQFTPKSYRIMFSRLFVNGKEVLPADKGSILQKSIGYTHEIRLKANQSMFSIEYATSNFIAANRDEIIYRLEGFSDEWTPAYRNIITYTNLNPGRYTLIVKSRRNDINQAKLSIRILPPWYKSWWAYLIYIVITGSLLLYLIRSYKSRIKLRESLKYEQKHTADIEALNQSKLRFFTNISHEFRTPLTLIVAQVETLLQVSTFTPTIYNKILGIYKSSIQLRELITELLDFRKQEQGHMKIKVSPHNLADFLYENYLLFLEYASSKQLNFEFSKSDDDIEIWYDQKQMQKVVNNLLSNAMKHTQAGDTIAIDVSKENEYAIVVIRDTGSGIDANEIDKIFDRFYQTERLDSLNTGAGTGIGLSLTKGIVELHHGDIRVESEPGKGSSFIIRMKAGNNHFTAEQIAQEPAGICQPEQPASLTETLPEIEWGGNGGEDKRIPDATMLIVEDNESIKQMLENIFGNFYGVITASDGEEAWEKVQKEMPTIVLSDVVMPRMSGTELCKLIKTNFNTCHIPVVLLTARSAVEHTIEGLRIGADDYITKPFNTNLLISRCNNLVNSRRLLQEKFSKQPQAFAQMLATNPMDKEMLDRAMEIIERNMDNTDFNINIFAREMGMARTNLFTKLKAVTGQTPNEFILGIRLKRGALMLRNNPELNITEISDRIGFSSSRYFSKCFKDIYHVSPLAYRKGEEKEEEAEEE
ncbi:hybrid sensor histidine kinase/response regulator transcription factor [Bacteroides pyogenes]|uniref:hybrid sensor histidine kinase/response regulator transcription factor n=2 Tax=Bacteroides pyogenes TaxID=310300 RepID=UPI001BABF8C2|nr:Sensor histidine kinase RcsC [Bacteroides pyogenes]